MSSVLGTQEHVMQVDLGHGSHPEEACATVAGLCLVGWQVAGAVGPVTMCPRDVPRDDAMSRAQDCSLTGLPLYPPHPHCTLSRQPQGLVTHPQKSVRS